MNGLSVRTGRANGMPTQAGVSRTTTATRVSHQRQARKVCLQRRRTIECSATAEAEKTANLSKYAPVGDRYLVTRYVEEAKTDGGILLSASAAENKAAGEKLLIGIVHSVPEAEEGSSPAEIKEGDKVLFAKYGATETSLGDENVYFVKGTEVLAVLELE